jgi:hypothetical protein
MWMAPTTAGAAVSKKKRIQTHSRDGRAVRSLFREDRLLLKLLLLWVAKKKLGAWAIRGSNQTKLAKTKGKKNKNKKLYKYIYTQKGRRCARDNRRWRDIQGKPPFANISD